MKARLKPGFTWMIELDQWVFPQYETTISICEIARSIAVGWREL